MNEHTHHDLMQKLTTYEEWKNCITVLCGIPLTKDYIEERIIQLNDKNSHHTIKFIQTWGEDHLRQVISWFEKANTEVS